MLCILSSLFFSFFLYIEFDYEFVTCGTVLKLLNHFHNVRLHSHNIKYGSGSGQQVSCTF